MHSFECTLCQFSEKYAVLVLTVSSIEFELAHLNVQLNTYILQARAYQILIYALYLLINLSAQI
jgi:hypothetical protein